MTAQSDPVGGVLEILVDGHPILRTPSTPVDRPDPELAGNIADLAATLADFRARAGFGRAISAPQCGIAKRLIVMNLGDGPIALINPEIVERSTETQMVWDDCLSVPDLEVLVERSRHIDIRFEDEAGATVAWRDLAPDLSELLEHECDHLDGVLMTDRAGPDAQVRAR